MANDLKCKLTGILTGGGGYDSMHDIARRVYDTDGAAPTLHTCGGGNLEPKIICEGNYSASNHNASRIVSTDGIAPAVMENHGTVTAIIEPHTAALRGRNPENPSDRTAGAPTAQRLEIGGCVSNTITTVTKDNYLAEPPTGRQVRVRKLTERECFRLMGVADADFDRVAQNQSKSGLYHMAGDSIVTTCLMAIFAPILGADYHQKIEQLLNMLCANNAKGAKS